MYDCLEEFTTCGYTYFPVKDISKQLKQKSQKHQKDQGGGPKANEYEKEYMVRVTNTFFPLFSLAQDEKRRFSEQVAWLSEWHCS